MLKRKETDAFFAAPRLRFEAVVVLPFGFLPDPRGARLTGVDLVGLVLTPMTLKLPVPLVLAMARIFTRRSDMARGVGVSSPSAAAENSFLV